mmetsp:Transcript_14181/g.23116  ORF Transcript_14181/g.23116 Transcript_14181/m.23116 type:complete len:129 (-) Transcript_14181:738-1124(-)
MRAWDFGQRQSLNAGNNNGRMGKPVILAPAMNTVMWDHPLTRMQLETIQHFFTGVEKTVVGDDNGEFKGGGGVIIVEPAVKTLACGEVGAGALAELDDIICAVKKCLVQWDADGCIAANNDVSYVEDA